MKAPLKNKSELSGGEPHGRSKLLSKEIPTSVPKLARLRPKAPRFQVKKHALQSFVEPYVLHSSHTSESDEVNRAATEPYGQVSTGDISLGPKLSLAD